MEGSLTTLVFNSIPYMGQRKDIIHCPRTMTGYRQTTDMTNIITKLELRLMVKGKIMSVVVVFGPGSGPFRDNGGRMIIAWSRHLNELLKLTHCESWDAMQRHGLFCQHCFRSWLGACWYQAMTCNNADLLLLVRLLQTYQNSNFWFNIQNFSLTDMY